MTASNSQYDSAPDNSEHIKWVGHYIAQIIHSLVIRAATHDQSKIWADEKAILDAATSKLRDLVYGSQEYTDALHTIQPAIDLHYRRNRHHPEHHPNGINDMTLVDLVEMLADWAASTKRHANGSISRSLEINKTRFGIGDQLQRILENTVNREF